MELVEIIRKQLENCEFPQGAILFGGASGASSAGILENVIKIL